MIRVLARNWQMVMGGRFKGNGNSLRVLCLHHCRNTLEAPSKYRNGLSWTYFNIALVLMYVEERQLDSCFFFGEWRHRFDGGGVYCKPCTDSSLVTVRETCKFIMEQASSSGKLLLFYAGICSTVSGVDGVCVS